jgi:trk system potassium uptake protein TrkH
MRLALVAGTLGRLLQVFACAYLLPFGVALAEAVRGGGWTPPLVFAGCGLAAFGCGRWAARWFRADPGLMRTEALAIVAGAWLITAHFAAIPYWAIGIGYVDGVFESISGLTTTGATVFTAADFRDCDRATFLWRALTQWIGGLGVIALFVVVLPQLGIAGRQIFFAEFSSATTEIVSPQLRATARRLWLLYVVLTLALALLLIAVAGMPLYDAACHALATTSAGGFSPHPQSIGGYANPAAEWILTFFMALAGVSLPLLWVGLFRAPRSLVRDGELRVYLGGLMLLGLAIAFLRTGGLPGGDALRSSLFHAASVVSSTGFATEDWNPWPQGALVLLLALMMLCGCAGSTGGGPKVVRLMLAFKTVHRELLRVLHPRGVLPIRHRDKPIPEEVLRTILAIVALYALAWLFFGAALVLLGEAMVPAFSAALACVNNVGPGLGPFGPMDSYSTLPAAGKLLLCAAMWLGRLEFVTVLVLLHPDVLRRMRWGAEGGDQPSESAR